MKKYAIQHGDIVKWRPEYNYDNDERWYIALEPTEKDLYIKPLDWNYDIDGLVCPTTRVRSDYVELVHDASFRKQLGAYLRNAGWEYDEYRGWIDIDYGDQVVYSKDDDEFSFYIMTDFPDCVAPDFDEFVERTEWYIRVSDKGYANAWNGLFWWEPIGYHTLDGAIDAAEKFINDFFAEHVQNKKASFKRSAYK